MSRTNKWNVVLEGFDEEEGRDTLWSKEVNHYKYGRYVWVALSVDEDGNDCYGIEVIPESNREEIVLKTCKTLTAAKRWATMNLDVDIVDSGEEDNSELVGGIENQVQEISIHKVFDKLLADYDVADNQQAKSWVLATMYNYLLNLMCTMDNHTIIFVYEMVKTLHCKYKNICIPHIDAELVEKAENHIVALSKHIDCLDQLVDLTEILDTELLLDDTLIKLVISEEDETKYSILLRRREKILEFIYNHLSKFYHYGYLKRLLDRVLSIPLNDDILTRINEAYLENDDFDKSNVKSLLNIDILMQHGCTKAEAIKHLDRGTIVFKTDEFYSFLKEEGIEYDDIAGDCGFVRVNDTEYVIMYVL